MAHTAIATRASDCDDDDSRESEDGPPFSENADSVRLVRSDGRSIRRRSQPKQHSSDREGDDDGDIGTQSPPIRINVPTGRNRQRWIVTLYCEQLASIIILPLLVVWLEIKVFAHYASNGMPESVYIQIAVVSSAYFLIIVFTILSICIQRWKLLQYCILMLNLVILGVGVGFAYGSSLEVLLYPARFEG